MYPLSRFFVPALLCGLLAATFLIYLPGLTGRFIFDDTVNIVLNYRVHLESWSPDELTEAWSSGIASQFGRPLSMMSFAFNHYFSGLNPYYFKLTNVVIHLVTMLAIYFLAHALLGIAVKRGLVFAVSPRIIALVIAACWSLHPLQVSTTLYVVQRMTQLAALVTVLTLIFYCHLRQHSALTYRQAVLGMAAIGLCIVVGILFKETAALTPLFILAMEVFLFGWQTSSRQQRFLQVSFHTVFLLIPAILAVAYMLLNPEFLMGAYGERDFTIMQRVLTEARVVWKYIFWVLAPSQDDFLFYYENYPHSASLFSPANTAFAMAGLLVVAAGAGLLRNKLPLLCFGIGFFLAGHALESTVIGLELVFEHRNYLPSFGLIFGIVATLFTLPATQAIRRMTVTASLVLTLILAFGTFREVTKWSNTLGHYQTLLAYQPDSQRLTYDLGYMYFSLGSNPDNPEYLRRSREFFIRSAALDERYFAPLSALILVNSYMGEDTAAVYRAEFARRLKSYQINGSGFLELHNLARCQFSEVCTRDPAVLLSMYTAIAQNTAMSTLARQGVLDQLATDLLANFNRVDDALAIYYLAESLSEEVTLLDIKIITLELEQGRTEVALRALQNAMRKRLSNSNFAEALRRSEAEIQRRLAAREQ